MVKEEKCEGCIYWGNPYNDAPTKPEVSDPTVLEECLWDLHISMMDDEDYDTSEEERPCERYYCSLISSYEIYKQELDKSLTAAADDFVTIGYLLRVAEDSKVLEETGYSSVVEFAKAEYGIDKTQVSRFIAINKRYSEDGYGPTLSKKYKNFGMSKLAEMLTLPAPIVDEITPDMTKEDIRTIKEQYNEEQKVSDIELMIEAAEQTETTNEAGYMPQNAFENIIYEFLQENTEEFESLHKTINLPFVVHTDIYEALAPSGTRTIISRVPGVGRLILKIGSADTDIVITNMRSGEKETVSWDRFVDYLDRLLREDSKTAAERYETVYDKPFPSAKVEETKQTSAETTSKKTEKKKAEKVTVSKKATVTDKKEQPKPVEEVEENVQEVEENAQEVETESQEVETLEGEVESPEKLEVAPAQQDLTIKGYKAAVTNDINRMQTLWQQKQYAVMLDMLADIRWRLEKIVEAEDKDDKLDNN